MMRIFSSSGRAKASGRSGVCCEALKWSKPVSSASECSLFSIVLHKISFGFIKGNGKLQCRFDLRAQKFPDHYGNVLGGGVQFPEFLGVEVQVPVVEAFDHFR